MLATLLGRAYKCARDLFSRERIEARPAFVVALICIDVVPNFVLALAYLTPGFTMPLFAAWLAQFSGFLVVALLVVACGREFARYNLERVSLICIIVFPGFLGPLPAEAPDWATVLWIVPRVALGVWLWKRLRAIGGFAGGRPLDILRYFFGGAAVAVLLILVATRLDYPYRLLVSTLLHARPLFVIDTFAINMSIAAAIEEPIFRGFLLGHLIRDRGWKPVTALLAQTVLSMAVHVYHLDKPYAFWVVVPFIGFVFGLVTLRTRNIATAMFAHAIYDTVLNIVAAAQGT